VVLSPGYMCGSGRAVPDLSTTQHPTLANHTVHGVQVPQVHQYQYIYTGGYVTW
jgi:hypothetical protein